MTRWRTTVSIQDGQPSGVRQLTRPEAFHSVFLLKQILPLLHGICRGQPGRLLAPCRGQCQLIPSHPIQTAHARDGDGLTRPASSSKVLTDVYRPTPHRPPVHRLGLPTRSMRTQPRATRGMLFTFLRRSWGGRRRQVWTPQNRGPACRGSVANPQPARASRK
jgi:hypothetical protein